MKELKSPDKIVQSMTRDGAVEVNMATGGAERISSREIQNNPRDNVADTIGGIADRVKTERGAAKKKAVRKANAKIYKQAQHKPETSRLLFTDAERGEPTLAKAIKKSDRAADRYEMAKSRIPKEKVLSIERVPNGKGKFQINPLPNPNVKLITGKTEGNNAGKSTNKSTTRLVFRERDKAPNGRLTHILDRPMREAAGVVRNQISQSDNIGAQSAGAAGKAAGSAARRVESVHNRLKFEPKAEEKAVKANVNALYKQDLRMKPEIGNANPLKKAAYKRKLKKNYAKSFRQGKKGTKNFKNAAKKTVEKAKQAVKFVASNWKVLAIIGAALLLLMMFMAGVSSCATMFGGGFNTIIATSYTAEDADILGTDSDYAALEANLQQRVDRIERDYSGYDEYRYNLAEIGHNPWALASYLTAKYNDYTRAAVQGELSELFTAQYTLTLTPVTEIRYRTETRIGYYFDEYGNIYPYTYEVQVQYYYYILNVTLVNRSLENVAFSRLTAEQYGMYSTYMETKGNRPELFP